MKVIYFIKWLCSNAVRVVKKMDRWMWAWAVTCYFASLYFSSTQGTGINEFAKIGLITVIVGFWICYGVIYTGIKTAWRKFNEEQNKVLDHLKDMG